MTSLKGRSRRAGKSSVKDDLWSIKNHMDSLRNDKTSRNSNLIPRLVYDKIRCVITWKDGQGKIINT